MSDQSSPIWRPKKPVEVVSFDCDATLSQIEGIDWLAEQAGCGQEVQEMTHHAMWETGITDTLYQDRLELVKPTRHMLSELVEAYEANETPDAAAVISALLSLGKTVCVLSAGLQPAVLGFATGMGVQAEYAQAVPIHFHENGNYRDYDTESVFTKMIGKALWLEQMFPDSLRVHIGDGLNDVAVRDIGVRMIGFGGGKIHDKVAKYCSEYIIHNSLAPILPLVLTDDELASLDSAHRELAEQGEAIIQSDGVRFVDTEESHAHLFDGK